MKRAIVVGSGPNGLSAAVALARVGVHVIVYEAAATPGGGARTEALTLPGFLHDAGAAVFPLGIASPFFRSLPLQAHGLEWIEPDVPVVTPLSDGDAVGLLHSLEATADLLGVDGPLWRKLMQVPVDAWPLLLGDLLGPIWRLPRHPLHVARFGYSALLSAEKTAKQFRTACARALFAGLAGHSNVPLHFAGSSAPALVLAAAAHTTGWPIARGGAGAITAAIVSLLAEWGGELRLDHPIASLRELPYADAVLLDVTPHQLLQLAGDTLPVSTRKTYAQFRPSPGICKVDWALSAPIPWAAPLCRRAGTIHIGESLEEVAASEGDAWYGRSSERPYVLLAQPSVFDPTRAPAGKHTAWAYCHVPFGSPEDFTEHIESQVERYAPGFRATILARHTRTAPQMEQWDANLWGGDVSGGAMTLAQIIRRPTLPPYTTPLDSVFLCSSSTPPGGGVHGMCGYGAAVVAAKHLGKKLLPLS